MNDDVVIIPPYLLEGSSDNISGLRFDLSDNYDNSDYTEQEEQEETELTEQDTSNVELILSDIYDELTDIHAEIVVLDTSINNVALCVQEFANVFVELFVVFVIMVLIKTVFDSELHFFK